MMKADLLEALRDRFATLTQRPVFWNDTRFPSGDFEGREATLHIFNVVAGAEWDMQRALRLAKKSASRALGEPVRLLFHTIEETTRLYPWVRSQVEPEWQDTARPGPLRLARPRWAHAPGHPTERARGVF